MAILVCGGAGYVGSHTVMELIEQGRQVVVVDTLEKGHRGAVPPQAIFYEGDKRDARFMDRVFAENQISAVIDFAAYSLVGESVDHPLEYYNNNVYGAMCLLKAMVKNNVRHLVFSSTAAVYGEPENIPILETDSTVPGNPYGETKLAIEKMLKWCDAAYGIKHVVLRYFNVAGAHKSGAIGEDHRPESHLIPLVLQTALGLRENLRLYGDDYPTPDGTCIRDYIHVTDLASAHVLAVDKLARDNESATYNLGNGKGFSVNEIIECAQRVTGKEIPVVHSPRRAGDPSSLVASSEKIITELGWSPKYNSLEQIIGSAWLWHQQHNGGYND